MERENESLRNKENISLYLDLNLELLDGGKDQVTIN